MTKEKALDAVEKAIDLSFDKGKELAIHDFSSTLQWCYNYVNKNEDSDEKTALIKHLKDLGAL